MILLFFQAAASSLANQTVTHRVTITVLIGKQYGGTLVLGLFGKVVPKTVDNFVTIANRPEGRGYIRTRFHRIISNFFFQGGDFTLNNGRGGQSIFGKPFEDENFNLKHEQFCVSMSNGGKNMNGSQFFITVADTPWLDGHHVVFGRVIQGFDTAMKIDSAGSLTGKPQTEVIISSITVQQIA